MSDTQARLYHAYNEGYYEGFDAGKEAGRVEFANELMMYLFKLQVKFPTVKTFEIIQAIDLMKMTK